uniref:Type II toxin-antitoxin system HipA family toxin n=1 Tax=Globodera pallida TaxID=36090 RepID=A0A183CBF6_GLOPA
MYISNSLVLYVELLCNAQIGFDVGIEAWSEGHLPVSDFYAFDKFEEQLRALRELVAGSADPELIRKLGIRFDAAANAHT